METTRQIYTVAQIVQDFQYNELEARGLFGLGGNLVIQPEYQRNFIYQKLNKEADVVASLLKGYPLGLLYFNIRDDGKLEVLDGQQRITSFGRYITDKFAIDDENGMRQNFSSLSIDKQNKILQSEVLVYECKGTESEIKEWFQTINIAGVPLNDQELLNAVYSGPFVNEGKAHFSNSNSALVNIWKNYIRGTAMRQDYWETALEWVSRGNISGYMAAHRQDSNIDEVRNYFEAVLDWVKAVFKTTEKEMVGIDWGRLYDKFHDQPYSADDLDSQIRDLYGDPYVKDRKGVWEYVLGGKQEADRRLLEIRLFDDATKRKVFTRQTKTAEQAGVSNCHTCATGHAGNAAKLYKINEMEADHVTAWSRGGSTSEENCELLCVTHNRAKGNK